MKGGRARGREREGDMGEKKGGREGEIKERRKEAVNIGVLPDIFHDNKIDFFFFFCLPLICFELACYF